MLDKKALDVVILHVAKLTSVADYLVLCSVESARQARAVADFADSVLTAQGYPALSIEGGTTAEWVLMDFGDVVAHVFQKQVREHYALERLWRDARRVRLPSDGALAPILVPKRQKSRPRRARERS